MLGLSAAPPGAVAAPRFGAGRVHYYLLSMGRFLTSGSEEMLPLFLMGWGVLSRRGAEVAREFVVLQSAEGERGNLAIGILRAADIGRQEGSESAVRFTALLLHCFVNP